MCSNKSSSEEISTVDIHSNGYRYDNSSFQFHIVHQCTVISLISPHAFTIQLTGDLIECEEFFRNMNEYYNSIDDLQIPVEYLRRNLLCVTYDPIISAWNRSQIMEYDFDADTVNVFFVDLNSWEENVPRSRLRFILTRYSSRPVYSLTCRLALIAPMNKANEWNDVACQTFQNVVLNCRCDVEFVWRRSDDVFYVNLFAPHDEAYVCLNDFLIHCQMARPIDDTKDEQTTILTLNEDGRSMHAMIALYWKAEETTRQTENRQNERISNEGEPSKRISLTKVVKINEHDQLIFAKYNAYTMLPWFTLSSILNEPDEEKIQNLASKSGFKPITIDPLSHPLLCSQLSKRIPSSTTPITLYSIDCARKLLQSLHCQPSIVLDLLDRARLAEARDDISFWETSFEVKV